MKKKQKGFTLIEVLVTILIIAIISGVTVFGVTRILNSSDEKSIELTINNLKSSSVDYVNENINNIKWVNDNPDNNTEEFTCVSIMALVNYGYYSKDILNGDPVELDANSYIKITRDLNAKNIINEEMGDDVDSSCSAYYVKIPTCNKTTYNGTTQTLIDINDYFTITEGDIEQINAGSYNYELSLSEGSDYNWSDGQAGTTRTLTCSLSKRKVTIKLNPQEIIDDNFEGNKYIGDTQTIMDNIIVTGLIPEHEISSINISKNDEGTKLIIDNVVITNIEDETNVSSNYDIPSNIEGNLTILSNKIAIPTNSICNSNIIYNGEKQVLATAPTNVTLSNNFGTDAGSYEVIATINEGYKWSDNTTEAKSITCSIGKTNATKLTLSNKIIGYTDTNGYFSISDIELIGLNNTQITNLTDDNINFIYYSDNNCTNQITEYSNIGMYYAKATATKLNNYNDISSNCASMEITNQITLTYNANGGSVNPSSKIINTGDTDGSLPTPTRTGYTFEGWYTELSGGSKVTSSTEVTSTTSHTIYARWKEKTIEVIFHSRSYGESGTDNTKTVTYKYSESNQRFCSEAYDSETGYCNKFTKTGYYIVGWYGKEVDTTWNNVNQSVNSGWISNNSSKSPINVYAIWKVKSVKVTFMRNLNSSDTASASQTFTYGVSGNKFGHETDGSLKWGNSGQFGQWDKTGYTLLGWATSRTTTAKQYSIYSGVTDNWINNNAPRVTLYAVWNDQTAPTCSVSKSNTNSISGVTVKVTCKDSGSGCKTSTITKTGLKSTQTYTVYDNAGNKGTCKATISSKKQYRYKTCDTCNRCSSAGCSKYSCSSPYILSGSSCYMQFTGITANTKCRNASGGATCECTDTGGGTTSSQTCRYRVGKASCSTYNKSCSSCGCADWGSWSSYSSTSCSTSSKKKCESRTVYY